MWNYDVNRLSPKKKKSGIIPGAACIILILGILILMYPIISNLLAEKQQENVIRGYNHTLLQMRDTRIVEEWKKAEKYNNDHKNYMNVLNIDGNGVMGYIEIPKIDIQIPIYHHANDESLKKGIGHLEYTGLPIGGINNHPVLLGHRGLPGAELFTRLDEMEIGDMFYISVLDQIFAYKVNQITIVLPEEVSNIKKENGRDMVTLVTCTPYGVNTHRLLVTGERTEYIEDSKDEKEMKIAKNHKWICCIIVILAGISLLLYPYFTNRAYNNKIDRQRKLYFHHVSGSENKMGKLHNELVKRNEKLFQTEQRALTSVNAYQKSTINLKLYGINNNTIGYITIPKMKICLPIFLGASEENMKKGAVHLTETSYPVGGINTNCVIAAHRGYSKSAMFREIEKLEIGDKVYIENFREKLIYKVVQLRIIAPNDIEQMLIREGKDMITLLTCHPYRKNSQRYVVFCERI